MNCAICYGREVTEVLDLGDQALAGAFLKPEDFATEKRYPLRLGFCSYCLSLQVIDRVESEKLFGRYFYRPSASRKARAHFQAYAEEIVRRFEPKTVVEIGCNDGVMLKHFAGKCESVIGVDPNAPEDIPGCLLVHEYFATRMAKAIGGADVVVANNVFAHVENIHGFAQAVREILTEKGVFVFEVHYLGSVLAGQYDAIYHEHVFYHSLLSLDRMLAMNSLSIFDAELVPMHGGSIRVYASKPGKRPQTERLQKLMQHETVLGYSRPETFRQMQNCVFDHRRALDGILSRLKRERQTVVAYGAAGRANTLLQWCEVESLAYVVDDCKEKHGFYTPGTHFEIRPELGEADYVLVTAWTYLDEIAPKCRGLPLIVPFPQPQIVAERIAA